MLKEKMRTTPRCVYKARIPTIPAIPATPSPTAVWTAAPALDDFEAVAEDPAAPAAEPEPDALVVVARPDEPAAPAVAELATEEREEFMLRKEDWRPARPVVL